MAARKAPRVPPGNPNSLSHPRALCYESETCIVVFQ
jgi:hypothetical protein